MRKKTGDTARVHARVFFVRLAPKTLLNLKIFYFYSLT